MVTYVTHNIAGVITQILQNCSIKSNTISNCVNDRSTGDEELRSFCRSLVLYVLAVIASKCFCIAGIGPKILKLLVTRAETEEQPKIGLFIQSLLWDLIVLQAHRLLLLTIHRLPERQESFDVERFPPWPFSSALISSKNILEELYSRDTKRRSVAFISTIRIVLMHSSAQEPHVLMLLVIPQHLLIVIETFRVVLLFLLYLHCMCASRCTQSDSRNPFQLHCTRDHTRVHSEIF